MSWLRNSPLRGSFSRKRSESTSTSEYDHYACYTSFQRHWQQALEIIEKTQVHKASLTNDDVLGVITHVNHMMSLLILEMRSETSSSSCLDFLLSENVLDKVHLWSCRGGQYANVMKLEQLKLFEMLLSNSKRELLVHEPVLRPLLKLLATCGECSPVEVEKRLVILLNQLCVSFIQNESLLDLFFYYNPADGDASFIIFSLLIPFVHREGSIGQQARDALLLCMALSKENNSVGEYIAQHSNFCPILATGLSGLYSVLPRKLAIDTEGWHCFTLEDASSIPELSNFLQSLEFCNAVLEMAHPSIQAQLLEYLYQGFLVPVMGPALHQDLVGMSFESLDSAMESSITEELIAATAYLNLFLRTITEPALFHTFLRFILCEEHERVIIINLLIERINCGGRLCLVTLSLFETLLDLNCEDLMLELVLRHLIPCTHVMLSQRSRVRDQDTSCRSAMKFLSLLPSCCVLTPPSPRPAPHVSHSLHESIEKHTRHASLSENHNLQNGDQDNSGVAAASYISYLREARVRIRACSVACTAWTYPYDGKSPGPEVLAAKEEVLVSAGESSGYESFSFHTARAFSRENSPEFEGEIEDEEEEGVQLEKEFWSFVNDSTADSSQEQPDSASVSASVTEAVKETKTTVPLARWNRGSEIPASSAVPNIGNFLNAIFQKLDGMPFHSLYVNLHLTGIISRLAVYPQPLLRSFLLNCSLVFQPSVRSLYQVLGSLKQRIDSYTSQLHHMEDLVLEARRFLQKREGILEALKSGSIHDATMLRQGGGTQSRRSSSPDIRAKMENKRRTLPSVMMAALRLYNTSMDRKTASIRENILESVPDGTGYRYIHSGVTIAVEEGEEAEAYIKTRHVVLCAAVLEEWLQELAAIAQEHAVAQQEFLLDC